MRSAQRLSPQNGVHKLPQLNLFYFQYGPTRSVSTHVTLYPSKLLNQCPIRTCISPPTTSSSGTPSAVLPSPSCASKNSTKSPTSKPTQSPAIAPEIPRNSSPSSASPSASRPSSVGTASNLVSSRR